MINVHKLFLASFFVEIVVMSAVALLDLGFSANINSNFFARFNYIFLYLLFFMYGCFFWRKSGLVYIQFVFIAFFGLAAARGLVEGQFNTKALSHIFYFTMPILGMFYGRVFYRKLTVDVRLLRLFTRFMVVSFWFGLIVVALFTLGMKMGWASYNAIGLWNFIYASPFLSQVQGNPLYLFVGLVATAMAGKRGTLLAFLVLVLIFVYLIKSKRRKIMVFALLAVAVVGGAQVFSIGRFTNTYEQISQGEYNEASGRRVLEATSAMTSLNDRKYGLLTGAGLGGQFLPWPKIAGYETYYSHYTHFSFISYIWIGGLLLPFLVYGYLIKLFWQNLRLNQRNPDDIYGFLTYWVASVLVVSSLGAVLMNNIYLWVVIGMAIERVKASRSIHNPKNKPKELT